MSNVNTLSLEDNTDENISVAVEKQQKKRVRFHPSTKKNDGMYNKTDMFNEYMRDVLRKVKRLEGQTTVKILAKNLNVMCLFTIQKMLADLIWRCDRSRRGRTVINIHGGGTAGRITRQHIPYLVSHMEYLEIVIVRVRAVIAWKEEQSLLAATSAGT
jgi:hypothetical protein